MFGAVDDDDLDFNPAAGSKLASLFGLEKSTEKGNASLTYTAPKQPKSSSNDDNTLPSKKSASSGSTSTSVNNKLALIAVKAVSSFKLEDGNYNPQGKLGLALLGNSTSHLFQLLLYKGKQQKITAVRVSSKFQFTVQPHLYASFYDDQTQNWSVMFESKEDAVEFTAQVAVAKYRSASPSEESIISQELLPGTGDCFREGETIQLKLSAQPFAVDSVQVVDLRKSMIQCTLMHKLSNSGWAAGIMGAAPGAIRVILAPLNTQIPWLTSKRNEPLLIEARISSVSSGADICKEAASNEGSVTTTSAPLSGGGGGDSAVDSSAEDSSVRARGASIKEALTSSPRSNKASIISRMARMGQATLPLKGAITCNPSDSEETEEDSESVKPPLKSRPVKSRSASSTLRQQPATPSISPTSATVTPAPVSVMQAQPLWNQHQQNVMQRTGPDGSIFQIMTSEGQLVSLSSQQQLPLVATTSAVMSPTDPTQHMSMFLSEARIQNTEMRMHLSKFNDKVDQLMTKVDNLNISSGSSGTTSATAIGLEPNVLLSSIEKLVRDNQSLQAEVAEKNKRLDEQNDRIFSLLNTNSKFLEQSSSLFEQKQLQEQKQLKQEQQQQQQEEQLQLINQMKEEKISLGNQLASLQNQLATVQELVQALQKSNNDLNQELEVTRCRLQEKENCLLEMNISSKKTGSQDQLQDLSQALEKQKEENLVLQEQITSERTKFQAERSAADDKCSVIAEQYKAEVKQLKDLLSKQSDQHQKDVNNLQIKCDELSKNLVVQPKQTDSSPSFDHVITDVKVMLNSLHKGLNQQFTSGESYEGAQIKLLISSIVKREALQFVGQMERDHISQNIPNPVKSTTGEHNASQEKSIIPESGHLLQSKTEQTSTRPPLDSGKETNISKPSIEPTNVEPSDTPVIASSGRLPETSLSLSDVKEEDNSFERSWRPLPPPPPLFNEEDDSDDWLT